jgi:hypothetical protein
MTPKQKREEIKRLLSLLEDDNRRIFMSMYAPGSTRDIDHVVDSLPAKRLDWALHQCKNTYYKIFKTLKGRA